ncbi:MAG: hypothetical protein MPEBLZ_01166 [Candidatus Methanoperedens nitroreducens]|uniref:Uncharacterized protein n=1 Tax=Candidatus Methanoperedens nitratireducens TaxID=1392998 RepID=A0A0P8E1Z5_9EURY|nr:MAG: hypothetical protein MPEBLZ_01166 [Candidatus Methanoperedens sp. BLZ1]
MKKFSDALTSFIEKYPEVWEAHEKTGNLIHTSGPLDKKTCHLIQLGMAASASCTAQFARMSLKPLRQEPHQRRYIIPSC